MKPLCLFMLVRKLHPTYSKWQIRNILHLPHDITLAVIQGKKIETPFYMRQPLKLCMATKPEIEFIIVLILLLFLVGVSVHRFLLHSISPQYLSVPPTVFS